MWFLCLKLLRVGTLWGAGPGGVTPLGVAAKRKWVFVLVNVAFPTVTCPRIAGWRECPLPTRGQALPHRSRNNRGSIESVHYAHPTTSLHFSLGLPPLNFSPFILIPALVHFPGCVSLLILFRKLPLHLNGPLLFFSYLFSYEEIVGREKSISARGRPMKSGMADCYGRRSGGHIKYST